MGFCARAQVHGCQKGGTMKVDQQTIEEFVRIGVSQALTDGEMAARLNVGASTVSHWRNKFGIRPADKFRRKFVENYGGDNALVRFHQMVV